MIQCTSTTVGSHIRVLPEPLIRNARIWVKIGRTIRCMPIEFSQEFIFGRQMVGNSYTYKLETLRSEAERIQDYCTVVQNRRDSMYTYIRSGTCTQSIVWELRTSPRNVLLQIAVLVVQNRRELHGPQEMYCCTSPIDSVPDFA